MCIFQKAAKETWLNVERVPLRLLHWWDVFFAAFLHNKCVALPWGRRSRKDFVVWLCKVYSVQPSSLDIFLKELGVLLSSCILLCFLHFACRNERLCHCCRGLQSRRWVGQQQPNVNSVEILMHSLLSPSKPGGMEATASSPHFQSQRLPERKTKILYMIVYVEVYLNIFWT